MIIDMLNNGMDSLKRGFSSYLKYEEIVKEKETLTLEDYFVLKQAVLSTHHGVEILLKCILNKKSEFLIVDEIDSNYKEAYKEKNQNGYQSVFQTSKAQKIHTITYCEYDEAFCSEEGSKRSGISRTIVKRECRDQTWVHKCMSMNTDNIENIRL